MCGFDCMPGGAGGAVNTLWCLPRVVTLTGAVEQEQLLQQELKLELEHELCVCPKDIGSKM